MTAVLAGLRVLISGAGFAGLGAARGLAGEGADVTVVERSAGLRTAGSPIDIRGDALGVVARWGLSAQIEARRLAGSEFARFVDASGTVTATLPAELASDSAGDVEIGRSDLIGLLSAALPASVRLRHGDSVTGIRDESRSVSVTFARSAPAAFDLVVGADGLHSTVRRLVFGPESAFARFLGVYVAHYRLPGTVPPGKRITLFNVPGRAAGVMEYGGASYGWLVFRSPAVSYDYRDADEQKQIVRRAYQAVGGWRVPELLGAMTGQDDFYFDSASQIVMPGWRRGRVVLIGDAGYSAAFLSGRGTSLALLGAQALVDALVRSAGDHVAALDAYTAAMRGYVERAQESVDTGRDLLVPDTAEAIETRNAQLRELAAGTER